jgi:hypothetical protein
MIDLIHMNVLEEVDTRILLSERFECRSDHLAWPTPARMSGEQTREHRDESSTSPLRMEVDNLSKW